MEQYAVTVRAHAETLGSHDPGEEWIEFYMADNPEHAIEQAVDANDGDIVCVAWVPPKPEVA